MFIVFDLDDTLANTDHRQHILDAEDFASETEKWNAFFDACGWDEPVQPLLTLLDILLLSSFNMRVEIWTGRSDRVREKTEQWIQEHLKVPHFYKLRMRAEGDIRPDTEIKAEFIKAYGRPDLVFDDRNKMVDWWRAQGVICCQVKVSDF